MLFGISTTVSVAVQFLTGSPATGKTGISGTFTTKVYDVTGAGQIAGGNITVTEVDATNQPGVYRVTVASGATGSTGAYIGNIHSSDGTVLQQDVGFMFWCYPWINALPAVAPAGVGGLPTVDANNAVKVQSGTAANQISLSSGLVALTAGEHTGIAADVLNAAAASYNTAATIGAKINAAGSAGDPWGTTYPGAYTSGQFGGIIALMKAKMDAITTTVVTVSAPTPATGNFRTEQGTDCKAADGTAITWGPIALGYNPVGATITFQSAGLSITVTATAVTGGYSFSMDLTRTQNALAAGSYAFKIFVALASTDVECPIAGMWTVQKSA